MARLLANGKIERTLIAMAVAKSHAVTKLKSETKLGQNRKQKVEHSRK